MSTQFSKNSLALIVILAIVSGFLGGAITNKFLAPGSLNISSVDTNTVVQPVELQLVEEESQVIEAIEKVSPAVVSIVITQELNTMRSQGTSPFELFFPNDPFFQDFFGQQFPNQPQAPSDESSDDEPIRQKVGGGSGFFISEEGLILTNRHVVARDDVEYTVITKDGTEFTAEVVSRDFFNDIAVIKVVAEEDAELPEFPAVSFGNSNKLKIGQSVIAIGNALAEFENSATKGIISAKGRQIVASDGLGRGENLSGLIQTDAAINPGNSGGPLINLVGEVVGVNTAIAANANGIGFAIPIDDVKPVVDSVKENGRIIRPILGVMFTMLSPELAKELELDIEEGALLKGDGKNFAVLPGKPAEKAGLIEKDVIIAVNGEEINQDNPLQQEIMKYAPGDTIKVKFIRKGEEREVEVTLEEANLEEEKEE